MDSDNTEPGHVPWLGEEIANAISHGVGLVAALAAAPFLLLAAAKGGGVVVVGAAVFALALVLMYLTSTLYHSWPGGRAKGFFLRLDHGAIFLLIAGTYTPFGLGVLRGWMGWSILALTWALALTGIVLKTTDRLRHPTLSVGLYLATGWLGGLTALPLLVQLPLAGVL